MQLIRDTDAKILLVRSCQPERIVVGDESYSYNLLLSPGTPVKEWAVGGPASLGAADFEPVLAARPDLVLLGTGARLVFPAPALHAMLLRRGIGLEIMDTAAACRTYNIVAMEGRSVVAALFQISAE